MKKRISVILLLLGGITTTACTKETNSAIEGKWHGLPGPGHEWTLEGYYWDLDFKSDDTYTSLLSCDDCGSIVTSGTYSYRKGVEELMLMENTGKKHVLGFTVKDNSAVLEEAGGKFWVFVKR